MLSLFLSVPVRCQHRGGQAACTGLFITACCSAYVFPSRHTASRRAVFFKTFKNLYF